MVKREVVWLAKPHRDYVVMGDGGYHASFGPNARRYVPVPEWLEGPPAARKLPQGTVVRLEIDGVVQERSWELLQDGDHKKPMWFTAGWESPLPSVVTVTRHMVIWDPRWEVSDG